jgi:hypothetical protein
VGDAPLADDPIDTRDDLGAVGEGNGTGIERLEVTEAEVHG